MSWPGGGAHLRMCSSFAFSSLSLGMSFFLLWCWLGTLFEYLWQAFVLSQWLHARLNLHAASDNFPDMTATWNNQAYVEDAKQDAVTREVHVSLLLVTAVQAAGWADGHADGSVEGLRWRLICRPGRDAIRVSLFAAFRCAGERRRQGRS